MPGLIVYICIFLVVYSPASAYSATDDDNIFTLAPLINQAEELDLAGHPYWLALVHYRAKKSGSSPRYISEIISAGFFLSVNGRFDPVAELRATIFAFFQEAGTNPDKHAQCRFVARYKWLKSKLDWDGATPPNVFCKKYREWSMNGQINSLSVVFATGYLGNPASYFGHMLLKFNTNRTFVYSDLLDRSMNYGAIIPENENALVYIYKGLSGGYEASFSHARFYNHNHIYVENEFRDLWEYQLSLTQNEVDQIVSHSWELLRARFDYYFIKQNCVYHMAKLLELVINQPLLPYALPWAIPIAVFDRLATMEQNGEPVVKFVRRIPSKLSRLHTQYESLNTNQQNVVNKFAQESMALETLQYEQMDSVQKADVIDTLIEYFAYRIVDDPENIELKRMKHNLLLERINLPVRSGANGKDDTPAPHLGPLPGMIRLGPMYNNKLGAGIIIQLRPAYYDILNVDAGRLPNSQLTMMDIGVVYLDGRFQFRKLDLVNISTLNISRTGLPNDGGLAWRVKFGFVNQDLGCTDCAVFRLVGGLGKAARVGSDSFIYAMTDMYVQSEFQNSGTIGVTAYVGLIGTPLRGWKTLLTAGYRSSINGTRPDLRLLRWENRFGRNQSRDVRLVFEEKVAREMQLVASFYW